MKRGRIPVRLRHSPLVVLALALFGLLLGRAHSGCAHDTTPSASAPLSDPERAAEINRTLDLIEKGGPFPHRQDGSVFVNREGRLPERPHGYYREFTVRTPGVATRGQRRIVRGAQGELYYTDDHYRTFMPLAGRPAP